MNKMKHLIILPALIFGILCIGSEHAKAESFPFPLPLSPVVDKVRDTYGNPLAKNTNYRIKVFSTDSSTTEEYYFYDSYDSSAYDWIWLTTRRDKAVYFQINSEALTDGHQEYVIYSGGGARELVRFQNDGTYTNGGLYLGYTGHSDRYGFRRIEGDRVYKYLLTSNYGGIFANFSKGSITTLSSDKYFIISFEKVY